MRTIEESLAFVRTEAERRARRRRRAAGLATATVLAITFTMVGLGRHEDQTTLSVASSDGPIEHDAPHRTTEPGSTEPTSSPLPSAPVEESQPSDTSTTQTASRSSTPPTVPPTAPATSDASGPPVVSTSIPDPLAPPSTTASSTPPPTSPPTTAIPNCSVEDLEFLSIGWGPLYVMEDYPAFVAPDVEATRVTFSVRAGPRVCRTTDSTQILEARDGNHHVVYRVTRRNEQPIVTEPGRWLDFQLSAPWDPSCQLDPNGDWSVDTCTAVGAGVYEVTLITHGVATPLFRATISA